MLTTAAVKAVLPRAPAYELADQLGLHRYIAPILALAVPFRRKDEPDSPG
jgi:hypothetical protein